MTVQQQHDPAAQGQRSLCVGTFAPSSCSPSSLERAPGLPQSRLVRSKRDRVIPDQHGAWAFLVLPVTLGIAAGGWSVAVLALLLAWIPAYPFSWALSGTLAAPRPQRFRRALLVWAAVTIPAAALALVLRPWLLFVGLAYFGAFLLNLRFARQRRERALANDLVLVAECTMMVPVTAGVAVAGGWVPPFAAMTRASVLLLTLACAAALVGSTLHVKSLIRERRNPRFARVSRWYAAGCLVVMAGVVAKTTSSVVVVLPFIVLALRALVVRDPQMRPARIGMIELACLVLLAGVAFAAV